MVKPSGLKIGVNTQTNPLERPIQAFVNQVDKNNQMKLDNLDNKIAEAKAENKNLVDIQNEQRSALEKAQNGMYDNILTSSKIELTNFETEMSNTYFDSPLLYESKMQEYVETKINSGIFPNTERALKYKLKAQELTKSSLKKITDNHLTKIENTGWDNITRYSDILTTKMREQIFSITDIRQLPEHLKSYTNSIIELEDGIGKFIEANPRSTKTPAEYQTILDEYREQHDVAMLEHVLTNMIMNPNFPETEELADTLYDMWQSGTLLENDDAKLNRLVAELNGQDKNVINDLRKLLDKHTYDEHTIDTKLRLESKIKTAIKNKKSEFVAMQNESNNFMFNEVSKRKDVFLNQLTDMSVAPPDIQEIVSLSIDKKGQFDQNIFDDLSDKVYAKNEFKKIIDNVLVTRDVTTALNDIENLKDKLKPIFGSTNPEELLYEAIFQTDTSGINTDAPRIINELALGYQQPNQRINPAVETLSNNIKTFGVFPKSMVDFGNRLTTLSFESDIDKQALISMAIIKVNTIGKGKSGNLDKDGSLSEALDTVHELVNTHGIDFAVERFKTMVNPDFADQKIRKDLMLDFAQTRFKSNDLREEFSDAFNGAIARTNLIDLPFYFYGATDIIKSGLGMESVRGERTLDNIVKYKNTFLIGTSKNLSIENSAYQVFEDIFYNKVGGFINTNNPSEYQKQKAMEDAIVASLNEMSSGDYQWSSLLYNPDQPYGITLTRMSPESMTGLDTQTLAFNATAFAYKAIQKMEPNDVALQFFGTPLNVTDMDDYNEFQQEFFQLAENGNLKLVPDTTTLDRADQQWFINIQKEDGSWGLLMDGVEPLSWKPNTNFTDEMLPYGKDGIYNEIIQEELNGLNITDPSLREEIRKSMTIGFLAQDKYAELGDWFQATFPNWGSDNFRKDNDVDTITEKITTMASKYEEKVVEKQEELNFQFKDEIEESILRHRSIYDNTIPSNLDELGALNYLKNKNEKIITTYNNEFNDIGVVVHPRHQFVIQDIIDVLGPEAVGKNSAFYIYLQNEQLRYARDYIDKLAPQFKNKQRHKALLNLWGNLGNVQSR